MTGSATALLPFVLERLRKLQDLSSQDLRFGSMRLSISVQAETELSWLQSLNRDVADRTILVDSRSPFRGSRASVCPSMRQVAPTVDTVLQPEPQDAEAKAIIRKTTCLLHESEEVVVVKYIETVVPVLYVMYLAILYHLSNPKYYQDLETMTEGRLRAVVTNILIYVIFELLSLVHVFHMPKHNFGATCSTSSRLRWRSSGGSTSAA